jgi:KDO2-lipid IV(A) lauroyltransferase
MLAFLLYYLMIIPVSVLPMPVLYGASRFFLLFAYNVFGYRKHVVTRNIRLAFPDKSKDEIRQIRKEFYRHFADMLAEGAKGYSISKKHLLRRFSFTNPELPDAYYNQGKSVLLVGGHYNNWEFLVLSLDLHFKHQGTGVGQAISSKDFAKVMKRVRSRYGMEVWNSNNVREKIVEYQNDNKPFICLLLADQSPHNPEKSYWVNFLNRDTPVVFGPEYLSRKYALPVYFYTVSKVKRGVYKATLVPITEDPRGEAEGAITEKHVALLEEEIKAQPAYWLWSHKRWKHKRKAGNKPSSNSG